MDNVAAEHIAKGLHAIAAAIDGLSQTVERIGLGGEAVEQLSEEVRAGLGGIAQALRSEGTR